MPFLFNIKALIGVIFSLAIILSIFFFFAFFAIIALPCILLLYAFRKKIFKYIFKKKFSYTFDNTKVESNLNNIYKNKNKDYIEVDFEKNKDEDFKN